MADYPDQTTEYEVSYDDDPIGFLKMQSDTLQQHLQKNQQELQYVRQASFMNEVNHKVKEFKRTNDDYGEALTFLTKTRRTQLSDSGVSDPAKQDHQINSEAWDITNNAMQNNENPAEVAYAKAKEEGYKAPHEQDAFDSLNDTEIDKVFEEMERQDFEETGRSLGIRD